MGRKVYDRQFEMAAVQLVLEENLFVKEVAKELSIHPNMLYVWISKYEECGETAFPGRRSALYNSQYKMKKLFNKSFLLCNYLELWLCKLAYCKNR